MRNRWMARGAIALLLGGGHLVAQSPTVATVPAALAQPRPAADSPIVLMRTAGQPDRQLKVLRLSNYPDGESVAEVQDAQTGQIFTLPGKVVAALPKAANAAAPPVIVAPPTPVPPHTRPTLFAPPPAKPIAPTAPKLDEPPMPKVTYIPAPEPTPKAEEKLPPAIPPPAVVPSPGASLVWRPRPAETPALGPITPVEAPKPDRWQPAKRMNLQSSLSPVTRTIVRATHHTGHDDDDPPAVRVLKPSVMEERAELLPVAYYRTVESQIREETQGYVYDLGAALRPSIREDAAICLAESRYGGRREVKTVLAKAAIADPAPSVRAKCIELLMRLGYHDPEYMEYLQSASVPGEAPTLVRTAAKEALAKLAPRKY